MLIWIGAAVSMAGLVGILMSAVLIFRARRIATSDEELRKRLNGLLPVNLGALFLSVLGLMAVVVGIMLG